MKARAKKKEKSRPNINTLNKIKKKVVERNLGQKMARYECYKMDKRNKTRVMNMQNGRLGKAIEKEIDSNCKMLDTSDVSNAEELGELAKEKKYTSVFWDM